MQGRKTTFNGEGAETFTKGLNIKSLLVTRIKVRENETPSHWKQPPPGVLHKKIVLKL